MTHQFDLIIFDCDGVLVDSEPLVNRTYVELLHEFGFLVDYEAYLREFSGVAMNTRLQAFSQRFNWTIPPEFVVQFHERLSTALAQDLKPIDGVHRVLDNLPMHFCVASNGSREEII